jgi:ribosomal protein S13
MKVLALLQSIRQVGSYRATTICSRAGVNPLTRLGDLTVRQRLRLMDGLAERLPSTRA